MRAERITLNFFQVYVYLTIIKYYSICLLKIYSNSFLTAVSTVKKRQEILLSLQNLIVKIFMRYSEKLLTAYLQVFIREKRLFI